MLVIALSFLAGCGDVTSMTASGDGGSSKPFEVPSFLQVILDSPLPAAGTVHAISRGRLSILERTQFCVLEAELDPRLPRSLYQGDLREHELLSSLEDYLARTGNSRNVGYLPRALTPQLSKDKCSSLVDPVIIRFHFRPNQQGSLYRVALTAAQGQSGWAGAVERQGGKREDVVVGIVGDGNDVNLKDIDRHREALSVAEDAKLLTKSFMQFLSSSDRRSS